MSEDAVERVRHLVEIERIDEEARVAELPPVGAAHVAAELRLDWPASPRRLLLEGAEGSEVALSLEHGFDQDGPERADQLVLEVFDADVEAEPFDLRASEVRAEAGLFEAAPEHLLLAGVAQPGQPRVQALGAESSQEASDRLSSPDRHDDNALMLEVATTARSEGFDRDLVAQSLDEDDRPRVVEPRKRAARRLRPRARHGGGTRTLLVSLGYAGLHRPAGTVTALSISRHGRMMRMVHEAPLESTEHGLVPTGDGWFVLNAREARWRPSKGRGAYCIFEGEPEFSQLGIHLVTLAPGEPMAMYHWEADQEDFLVLAGEALLIVEGEERPLRQWDFVHCPAGAKHVIVGAGDAQCLVLAVGARERSVGPDWGGYSVDEAALRHGAGVEVETTDPEEAYARFPERKSARYREGWLPG